MPRQLSSLSDGDQVNEYLDWRSGVFGQMISESLSDKNAGRCVDSTCFVEIDEEFGNKKMRRI